MTRFCLQKQGETNCRASGVCQQCSPRHTRRAIFGEKAVATDGWSAKTHDPATEVPPWYSAVCRSSGAKRQGVPHAGGRASSQYEANASGAVNVRLTRGRYDPAGARGAYPHRSPVAPATPWGRHAPGRGIYTGAVASNPGPAGELTRLEDNEGCDAAVAQGVLIARSARTWARIALGRLKSAHAHARVRKFLLSHC